MRVRCDVPPTTLGPLDEARRKIEHLLGRSPPLLEQARDRVVSGLRRRLLGDVPGLVPEGVLVESWNRLARSSDRPAALIFEAIDAADEASWRRSGASSPARVGSSCRSCSPSAARHPRARRPACSALSASPPVPPPCWPRRRRAAANRPPRGPRRGREGPRPRSRRILRALPAAVLRVLRAGALVGSGFEADLVAALLRIDVLDVLDLLQRAADAGVPIEDRGEGRFHLPDTLLDALRASTLPSLMIAQHRRLAELLGGMDEERPSAQPPVGAPVEAPSSMGPQAVTNPGPAERATAPRGHGRRSSAVGPRPGTRRLRSVATPRSRWARRLPRDPGSAESDLTGARPAAAGPAAP